MNTSVRALGAAGAAALLVAAAALSLPGGRAAAAPTAPPDGSTPARTITVSASSHVTLVPDTAHVSLGISVTKPTVEAARAEAAKVMNAIVGAAKSKGIAERDIRTTGISLSPQLDPCTYGPSACAKPGTIVGYAMSEQVDVTVHDLDVAGAVIDAATAAGATNVNGITFVVDDPDAAANRARVAAIGKAHDEADAMARAAGVSLGRVVSITESPTAVPIPYAYPGAASGARDVASPVQPGTQDVDASVTVVYEIG